MRYILSILFILFVVQLAFSQRIQIFNEENSDLISDDLLSVSVDAQGNKWIGTSKHGLVKFNEEGFFNFNKNNSVIKGDYVSPVFTDSRGHVWVSFSNPFDGIAKYDGGKWIVYSKGQISTEKLLITTIVEDGNGIVYFGGTGIFTYDGKGWSTLKLPNDNLIVRAIDIDDDGTMAIGHNGGLLIYKEQQWNEFTTENSDLRLATVRAVKFLNSQLYVGYGGGFGDGGFSIIESNKWTHFNKKNSKVPDHMIRDIEISSEIIWMATNNGTIKKVGGNIESIFFRDGQFKNVILDIAIENDVIWVATNFGLIRIN